MFRWAIAHFLKQQAQKHVSETVAEAVRHAGESAVHASKPDEQAPQDPSTTKCDVAIVMALNVEAGSLLDRLKSTIKTRGDGFVAYTGQMADRRVLVALSGPGCTAARRTAAAVIFAHQPQWLISAGFAGGLQQQLHRSDLIVADRIRSTDGESLTLDFQLEPTAGLHVGTLLTVDQIISSPDEKRQLGQQHDAIAVDMETWAVADECRQSKQRFLSVRTISDAVDDRLPDDIDHLMHQKTWQGRAGAVTGTLFRRPASAKDMWRLKRDALAASERLAEFIVRLLPKLD